MTPVLVSALASAFILTGVEVYVRALGRLKGLLALLLATGACVLLDVAAWYVAGPGAAYLCLLLISAGERLASGGVQQIRAPRRLVPPLQ